MNPDEIRNLRMKLGLSQTEFAALIDPDLGQHQVSRWETGRRTPHKFYVALLEQIKRNYERGVYTDDVLTRIQMKALQEVL